MGQSVVHLGVKKYTGGDMDSISDEKTVQGAENMNGGRNEGRRQMFRIGSVLALSVPLIAQKGETETVGIISECGCEGHECLNQCPSCLGGVREGASLTEVWQVKSKFDQ